jgi:hypothetical protein
VMIYTFFEVGQLNIILSNIFLKVIFKNSKINLCEGRIYVCGFIRRKQEFSSDGRLS